MIGREELHEFWATLGANKLRTTLTGFAVGWGIFLLVVLLSAGQGVNNGIKASLKSSGMTSQEITLRAGFVSEAVGALPRWHRLSLYQSDYEEICQVYPDKVELASAFINSYLTLAANGITDDRNIIAVEGTYAAIHQVKLLTANSRFINDKDQSEGRKVVVLPESSAKSLYQDWEQAVGRDILINGIGFRIIGICRDNNGKWSAAYIPLKTMQILYNTMQGRKPNEIRGMTFICPSIQTEQQLDAFSEQLRRRFAPRWGCKAEDESILSLRSSAVRNEEMSKVSSGIDTFLWIIGLSTLVIGLVGVINIMQITVSERKREIGVRKALGAKPRDIITMVLIESVLLTIISGLMGLVVGVGVMRAVDYVRTELMQPTDNLEIIGSTPDLLLNPMISLPTALMALVVMLVGGLLAGYLPARRAVRIPVVEAMRR